MNAAPERRKFSIWIYFLVPVVAIVATMVALILYTSGQYREFFMDHLRDALQERAHIVAQRTAQSSAAVGDASCVLPGSDPIIRITVIPPDGWVLCDSQADRTVMDNHRNRPEIAEAFHGKPASIVRYSHTVSAYLLYVAIPAGDSGQPEYVVRTAMPLTSINELLSHLMRTLIASGVVLVIASIALSTYLYRKVNPPLQEIMEGANRFARGRFESKLPAYDIREIDGLAANLNRTAQRLEHLETVRRDFVANVSHELKTPITSIKGFISTLRDGAKDSPQDLDRFLEIVDRQSQRLDAIVDDLLTLSRLESESAGALLNLYPQRLEEVLSLAKELCLTQADAKNIRIHVECDPTVVVSIDRSLMSQAIVNLVDNAVKYSSPGTRVTIRGFPWDSKVRLDVADEGPGIAPEHQARLFERFYRVDKARSQRIGGTGLGLAIVKHIATIHNGSVSVESELGRGSVFHVDLPRPRPA